MGAAWCFSFGAFSHLSSFSGWLFGKVEIAGGGRKVVAERGWLSPNLKAQPSCRMVGNGYCVWSTIFYFKKAQYYLSQLFIFPPKPYEQRKFQKIAF